MLSSLYQQTILHRPYIGHKNISSNKEKTFLKSSAIQRNDTSIGFGCMYCALVQVAKESNTGKKLFNDILSNPSEAINSIQSEAFYKELMKSAQKEIPPVPFDTGLNTHFISPTSLYSNDKNGIKSLSLISAMIKDAPDALKDAYFQTLNTNSSKLFQENKRSCFFLSSHNIENIPNLLANSNYINKDSMSKIHTIHIAEREQFAKAQAFPYSVLLTKFSRKDNNVPELLIGDIREGIGMQGSNSMLSSIERVVASSIDKELNHSGRPEKFNIRIPQHLLKRLNKQSVDILTRSPIEATSINELIKYSIRDINNKIAGNIVSSIDDDIFTLRSKNHQLVKESGDPEKFANLYLEKRLDLSRSRGLGFKKVKGTDGENLILEVDLANKEKNQTLLLNIKSDLFEPRIIHLNNRLDPAFNGHN